MEVRWPCPLRHMRGQPWPITRTPLAVRDGIGPRRFEWVPRPYQRTHTRKTHMHRREDGVSGLFWGHAWSLEPIKKRHTWEKTKRGREREREREREGERETDRQTDRQREFRSELL